MKRPNTEKNILLSSEAMERNRANPIGRVPEF